MLFSIFTKDVVEEQFELKSMVTSYVYPYACPRATKGFLKAEDGM